MSRPSEPLLAWLRELTTTRGMNTAAVASRARLSRGRVRKVLSGAEDMTVDELLAISTALEVSPADMGLGQTDAEGEVAEVEAPTDDAVVDLVPEAQDRALYLDPFGNHRHQLFAVLVELGCDFSFLCRTDSLVDSGIPDHVLESHAGRPMLITLDAAYHRYNNPRYDEQAVTLTLSFDALYECRFPWSAITEIIANPTSGDPEGVQPAEPSEDEDEGRPTHLRLV